MSRIANAKENGLECEADQRHAEVLMRGLGTDEGCNGVVTPGCSNIEGGHVGEMLVGGESLFRAVAARGN